MAYQMKRYRMDFESKGISSASIFLGVALFLRFVYYFGFGYFFEVGVGQVLIGLILPCLVELGAITLLRAVRLNAPGIFGIFGALACLLLAIQSFQYGSVLRIILALLAYLVCGGLFFSCFAGWLSKEIGTFMLTLTAVVRILFFDLPGMLGNFRPVAVLPELAGLCVVLGLCCMSVCIKHPKK